MSTKEEWRPIKGYEGFYEVSSLGRVRSLDRVVKCKNGNCQKFFGKIMKPRTNKDGYLTVALSMNNKQKSKQIHRLVAITFLPNPKKLPQVNHRDCNKQNNYVDNLEWCSCQENIQHALKTGVVKQGSEHHNAKLSKQQVQEIRAIYKPRSKEYNAYILARKYNVSRATIWRIITKNTYKN